ncbi:MAG: type II toxin-antitoxin system RelE/ParE family toxin [Dehalococcoidia bacterium]
MTVFWTEDGVECLVQIAEYLQRYSEHAASRMLIAFVERVELVDQMPYQGRMVPKYRTRSVREVIVRDYHVWYRVVGSGIHVIGVFHGRRDLG